MLNSIVGAPIGAVEGYKYSKSLVAANEAGLVWDEAALDAWLADPRAYIREATGDDKAKSKMTLKLKSADDRAAVIAYLGSL